MCRVMSGAAVTDEEIQAAEEKFNESRLLAEVAMRNLLENDVRRLSTFTVLISSRFFLQYTFATSSSWSNCSKLEYP